MPVNRIIAMLEHSERSGGRARPKIQHWWRTRWPVQLRRLVALALMSLIAALTTPFAPTPALAFDSRLLRYPYLTDLVGSSAIINWATSQPNQAGRVRWGKVGTESCTAHATPASSTPIRVNQVVEYQWKSLVQLMPGAEYCYRIYLGSDPPIDLLGSDPSPHFSAQLPAGSTQPFAFAISGDWGAVDVNGNNTDQANLMQRIATSGARFAITTGDNAYPAGSQSNYGDLVQTGGNISGVFGPAFWTVAGASIPLFPTIGNHGLSSSTTSHPQLLNFPQDNTVKGSGRRYRAFLHPSCRMERDQ